MQPLSGSLQTWQTCTPRSAFRGWAICVPFQDLRSGVNVGFSHNRGRPYFDVVQKNCFPWKLPYIGSKSLILLHSNANPIFKLLCNAGCAIIYSRLFVLYPQLTLVSMAAMDMSVAPQESEDIWVGWWVSAEAFESWPLQRFPGSRH